MIAIIAGGRHYTDGTFLFEQMDRLHAEFGFTCIVEGGQRAFDKMTRQPVGGADFFAHEWAISRGVPVKTERAKWTDLSFPDARILVNGRGQPYDANAGMRRNRLMFEKYRPGVVVTFSPSGNGTRNMAAIGRAGGALVIELVAP